MAANPKKLARPSKDEPKAKAERGRPTLYSREIADEICRRISDGETLTRICSGPDMPSKAAVLLWVRDDRGGFADRYAHARELQLDGIADEILDIVDDSRNDFIARESQSGDVQLVFDREHVDRTRLRVDARKWLLTKLKPQKFGDKVEQTHKGDSA